MASSSSTIAAREPAYYVAGAALPTSALDLHWYAAYTYAKHEKRVAAELGVREVEHFLPLYSSVRRWKDRRVQLELPLFPGYVFVRLALCNRLRVVQIPSVVRLVGFGGLPTALPDSEMEILRSGIFQGIRAEPHPFLTIGRTVLIKSGPLAGLRGVVVRKKAERFRIVLCVEAIMRSVSVEVDIRDIEPIRSSRTAN